MQNIENNFQKYNYKCMLILLLSINDIPIYLTIIYLLNVFVRYREIMRLKKLLLFHQLKFIISIIIVHR